MEKHEPAELNKLLEKFYAEVKNKNGDDYELDTLKLWLLPSTGIWKKTFTRCQVSKTVNFTPRNRSWREKLNYFN